MAFGSKTDLFLDAMERDNYLSYAIIQGDASHPSIGGKVRFYKVPGGTLVEAEVFGLPREEDTCTYRIFAMHVHAGEACTGTAEDPFANAGGHYNPNNCKHPEHAGDLPPLFGCSGYAWSTFLTNRFTPEEIIGHTVIIHAGPDDFTSQPSGNSGAKIACGLIRRR